MSQEPASDRLSLRALLLLLATIAGWGLAWPMIKIGVTEIPPWTYRGFMLPTAGLIMFGVARAFGERFALPTGQWSLLLASTFLNVTCWALFSTLGVRLMGSGHASIIAYTMPLWAVILSMLVLSEQPTARRVVGLMLGLGGLFVLLSGEFGAMSESPLGTFFMLVSAVTWGAGTVLHKRVTWSLPSGMNTAWMVFLGGLPIAAVALVMEADQIAPISWQAAGASVFVLVISVVFCWFAWFSVVKMVPVIVSSVAIMGVPVVAVISGGLILHEKLAVQEFAALALVLSAIALVVVPARR
jgi:drug/metabolite transporter (DMT)-like permease